MPVLNRFSFVIGAVVLLAVAALALRHRRGWVRWGVLVALVVVLAGWHVVSRPGTGDVSAVSDVSAALASEEPVVLQFFSNY